MGDNTLFFYGTLLAPPVLYRVIYGTPRPDPLQHPAMNFLQIRPALLKGYTRHRVQGADYPAIIPDPTGNVRGSVVRGLTDGDVYRLDIFEGEQYSKAAVAVEVLDAATTGIYDAAPDAAAAAGNADAGDGKEKEKEREMLTAQTYVWSAPEEYLEAKEWDFEDFKARKMRAWMGDPADDVWSDYGDEPTGDWDKGQEVQVDSGFADVDEAVRKMEQEKTKRDPTGGRGVNGAIGRQLAEAQQRGADALGGGKEGEKSF